MTFGQQFPQENAEAIDVVLLCGACVNVLPVLWWNVSDGASGAVPTSHLVGISLPPRQTKVRNLHNNHQFHNISMIIITVIIISFNKKA